MKKYEKTEEDLAEKLISSNSLCVLATASLNGKPEAATIEYVYEGGDFYFVTKRGFVKYKNLKINPKASIVITEGKNTVQIDGVVKELKGDDANMASSIMTSKLGQDPKIYLGSEWKSFKFTPTEIRTGVFIKISSRFQFEE
ncbi:pyridoxamine 5'-phosphate oxidase family protein [Candidatus Pacearchaeota archaeon]|nr:pyridoxamine 5'-phosphate oxidase family protein [Candidatus Pacearchaeota archaeon]